MNDVAPEQTVTCMFGSGANCTTASATVTAGAPLAMSFVPMSTTTNVGRIVVNALCPHLQLSPYIMSYLHLTFYLRV